MRNRKVTTKAATLSKWLAPSLLSLAVMAGANMANAAGALVPPQGYYAPIEKVKAGSGSQSCDAVPPPFTGSLQFRSKYEGSDSSRSTFNADSDKAFRDATLTITKMERGTSKLVMQYMRDGNPGQLDCALNWLTAWAQADALESKDFNHTGKSMRKWALGSLASAYLHLKFSNSHPMAEHQQQAQVIEAWFAKLGTQVMSDWDNLPLQKNNNHTYWAAWSVMATSVVLNRRDMFDWSVKEFKLGASQIGSDGYLPNELKRQQRALSYHNYAMAPLTMIASFAQANNVDVRPENNNALQRLGEKILLGQKDPREITQKAGRDQDLTDMKDGSKYAWLEPYCTLFNCTPDEIANKRQKEPFKSFRLGGDLTRVFDPAHEKGGGS